MPVAGTGPKNGITLRLSREGMMPYKNASYQACCKAYYTDPHEAHVRPWPVARPNKQTPMRPMSGLYARV